MNNRYENGNRIIVPSKRLKDAHRATREPSKDGKASWTYPLSFRQWLRGPQSSTLMEARDAWKAAKRALKKGV